MLAVRLRHGIEWHAPVLDAARMMAVAGALCVHARQIVCGIRGHDVVLGFEPYHIVLKCLNCDWRSAGWWIDPRRARHAASGKPLSNGERPRARLRA